MRQALCSDVLTPRLNARSRDGVSVSSSHKSALGGNEIVMFRVRNEIFVIEF